MNIHNMMESRIKAAVNDVLSMREDRFLLTNYVDDIVAYVLNRVPPRYVTSERGFIHNEIDFSIDTQLQADIRFCVEDAINTIVHRREPELPPELMDEIINKHYFFPYVVGEVLDETTFSIISDVEVRLYFNDKLVPMIDPGWINPYITSIATKGYYLFWPDFLNKEMSTTTDNLFKIVFRHKNYLRYEAAFQLRAQGSYSYNKSKVIPLALLKANNNLQQNE